MHGCFFLFIRLLLQKSVLFRAATLADNKSIQHRTSTRFGFVLADDAVVVGNRTQTRKSNVRFPAVPSPEKTK